MPRALEGRTIAVAEGRQIEDLIQMLEKEGAMPIRCPMVSMLDTPDPSPVLAWLRDLMAGRFAYVILMTGEALRRLLGFAAGEGMREAVIAALARTCTVTRGPKPVQALKEIGLAPTRVATPPTTAGVIAALQNEPLSGQTVSLTLYGEPNSKLVQFLEQAGATVRTVMPYVYAPAADSDKVAGLIDQMAQGAVDVIVFTSSPQVDRLYEVAAQRGLEEVLRLGLSRTRIAAIGPVLAEHLRQKQVEVHICPDQGFVMKNLVQQIKRELE